MSDENCGICSKELEIGEKLYITGGATLEADAGSASGGCYADPSDEEIYTTACVTCGEKISDAICELMKGA